MRFKVLHSDGAARVATIKTAHGTITTPAFMPVATHGAVKTLTPTEVSALGSQIILSNTYHLYLSPGVETVEQIGGIHNLIGYPGPILTDSGGYQVFSLGRSRQGKMAEVDEEGVTFKSHRDGSLHRFTPKKVVDIQYRLGVDIMMPLDDCPPSTANERQLTDSMQRTHRWLQEQVEYWQSLPEPKPALFGITQGATSKKLRRQSINFVSNLPVDGCALGGLAVGESSTKLHATVKWAAPLLPADRPRYLMGVGNPKDILWAVRWGIDLFDCVLPTRLARHGTVWLVEGSEAAVSAFLQGNTVDLLKSRGVNIVRRTLPKSTESKNTNLLQPAGQYSPLKDLTWARAHHLAKEREIGLYRQFSAHNIFILNTVLRHTQWAIAHLKLNKLATKISGV